MWFKDLLIILSLALLSNCEEKGKCSGDDNNNNNIETLILTHVLFRHGYRTPDNSESYPKDPYLHYDYFPFGRGQLTNQGKRREYSIGVALRERYNEFLGEYYYPGLVEARSTEFDRTKESLQLALAGLFPPRGEEKWSDLNWQPLPQNYTPLTKDKLLFPETCPYYQKMYQDVIDLPEIKKDLEKYKEEIQYIAENSGKNISSHSDIYFLYFGLTTESEWGLELPSWTSRVYPDFMKHMAIKEYFIFTYTRKLIQVYPGFLIQKIIDDSKSKINNQNSRKMHLYSAHEMNVACMLRTLDVYNPPHIPPYGAHIIFEIHNMSNTYGIKIFYQNYTSDHIHALQLPSCDFFCPLDKFESLIGRFLPEEECLCE